MRIVFRNSFHRSEVTVNVPALPYTLSQRQSRVVRRALCYQSDCYCWDHTTAREAASGDALEISEDQVGLERQTRLRVSRA